MLRAAAECGFTPNSCLVLSDWRLGLNLFHIIGKQDTETAHMHLSEDCRTTVGPVFQCYSYSYGWSRRVTSVVDGVADDDC